MAQLGEFGLISRLTAGLPLTDNTLVGPGDDAALVSAPNGSLLACTDLVIENRHFRRDWSSGNDVGHKAAARNFADIVAMGGQPTSLLIGLACPPGTPVEWLDDVMTGFVEECAEVGAGIIGGDVSAADVVMLAVTALGDLQGRKPILLSGAQVGDSIAVAGRLGWAAAGFATLSRGFRSPVQVVNAHRRPEPPYRLGVQATDSGATAMTDVSDGLVADLGHIAAASGVRMDLRAAQLAPAAKLRDVGQALNVDPMNWVLGGGDDYALAATFAGRVPDGWQEIGTVTEGSGVRVDGHQWRNCGHEHFR